MAVQLASARIDENGNISGGKAGDQNKKEVSTRAWYKHSKGWTLLRPKDAKAARLICEAAKAACANNHIGYNQFKRLTLYDAAKLVGWDCAKVAKDVETDCSALVRVLLLYAGLSDPGNFTTGNQVSLMMATGEFIKLTDSKYTAKEDYLREGDILVTNTKGHTEVVISDGKYAEWDADAHVFGARPLRSGCSGTDVKLLQEILIDAGYSCGKYGADGDFGKDTEAAVKAFQANNKLEADGIVGDKTYAAIREMLAHQTDPDGDSDEPEPETAALICDLIVAPGSWNLREGAGAGYPVVAVVCGGDRLKAADAEGWRAVEHGDTLAWVSEKGLVR